MGFFHSLRGKLILTYTLVTVLALLALEVILLITVMFVGRLLRVDTRDYLGDVVNVLYPQARFYLQPGQEDYTGLQNWLEGVYSSGYASYDPSYTFDSPAAKIVRGQPIYMLSPEGTVLAEAPRASNSMVGRPYASPEFINGEVLINRALAGQTDVLRLYQVDGRGKYFLMVPIWEKSFDSDVVGVLVLTVEPPPPFLLSAWPVLLGWVLATGVVLILGVAPFAALFGLIMSRGLTGRLQVLAAAADAWSEGVFKPLPPDRSHDEISMLGKRMWNMAERIQVLLQTQQQLASLEERNRLARELHDTVKQQNFATLMQLRAARNLMDEDLDEAGRRLSDAEALIKTSQQELNRMIAELRPAELEGRGLSEALRRYAETWSQLSMIPVEVEVQGDRRLPLEREQALYRVAQEALSNVARHSHASAVNIRLLYENDRVCLVVSDNGAGFNTQQAFEGGYGLNSMTERLSRLGGSLEVASSPGRGTALTAALPPAGPSPAVSPL